MKLGKEEIQKIVLGGLVGMGVVYSYFDLLLGPLKTRHANTQKSIAALQPEISKAKGMIARGTSIRDQAPLAQATIAQIDAMIPEGAPVAWFPTRMTEFFKTQGIDKVTTRMTGEAPLPSLTGYRRITWNLEIPKVECLRFGAALAALENSEPLISVEACNIDTQREEPDIQRVTLTLSNIVKQ